MTAVPARTAGRVCIGGVASPADQALVGPSAATSTRCMPPAARPAGAQPLFGMLALIRWPAWGVPSAAQGNEAQLGRRGRARGWRKPCTPTASTGRWCGAPTPAPGNGTCRPDPSTSTSAGPACSATPSTSCRHFRKHWRSLTHPDEHKMIDGLVAGSSPAGSNPSSKTRAATRMATGGDPRPRPRRRARRQQPRALRLAGANPTSAPSRPRCGYARSLLEASLDPLMTIGLDGRIMDVNEAAENLTGLPRTPSSAATLPTASPRRARPRGLAAGFVGRVRTTTFRSRSSSVDGRPHRGALQRQRLSRRERNVAGAFAAARDVTPCAKPAPARTHQRREGGCCAMKATCCKAAGRWTGRLHHRGRPAAAFPDATGRIFTIDALRPPPDGSLRWTAGPTRTTTCAHPHRLLGAAPHYVHGTSATPTPSIPAALSLGASDTSIYLCLPLRAQGQALGVIHLIPDDPDTLARTHELAETVADSLSLGLANLRLRENPANPCRCATPHRPLQPPFHGGLCSRSAVPPRRAPPRRVAVLDLDQPSRFNDDYGLMTPAAFRYHRLRQPHAGLPAPAVTTSPYRYGGEVSFCWCSPHHDLRPRPVAAGRLPPSVSRLVLHCHCGAGPARR